MFKQFFRLFLYSCALVLGLLTTMANAEEVKYFTIDVESPWDSYPISKEGYDEGVLVLRNTETDTRLTIYTMDFDIITPKQDVHQYFEKSWKSDNNKDGPVLFRSKFDKCELDEDNYVYICYGDNSSGDPEAVRNRIHKNLFVTEICEGSDIEDCFVQADKIRFKEEPYK